MRIRRAGIAGACALAASAAVLAGCGSGGGASTPSSSTTAAAATGPTAQAGESPGSGQTKFPASQQRITTVVGSSQTPQQAADAAMNKTSAPGAPSDLSPLPPRAFRRPVAAYRVYAVGQARRMAIAVARLRSAIAAGDRGTAKAAWLDAYDRYLRLGAAYGALGDLDAAINGRPGSLPGGVHDPNFSGLHRVEYGLWRHQPLPSLAAPTAVLAADVGRLPARLATMETTPLEYATRAHEILEDAQRDMLSGTQAPWSGADLRATADSLAATEEVVSTLRPLLAGRGSVIEPVEAEFGSFRRVLAAVRRDHGGGYPPLQRMSQGEHERVDGALGALLERLAAIPGALEVVPPPRIPTIAAQEARQ